MSGLHEEWLEPAQPAEAEPEAALAKPAAGDAAPEPPAEGEAAPDAEAETVAVAEPPAPEQLSSGHRFKEAR